MDVKIEDAGPCRKVLHVQAPATVVADDYAKTVRAVAAVARLPGFRPGKAPLPVVERRYAQEIQDETKDRLVPQLYRQALAAQDLRPVAIVEVKNVAFGKDTGIAFQVTVDVAPSFELPAYTGIPVAAQPVEVKDADVDQLLENLRTRMARYTPAAGRAAQAGDLLKVDYTATCEGKPLAEVAPSERSLGEASDFLVHIGEPEFLPGFTAGLTGAAAAETREVQVAFPAEHPVQALAGRTAAYRVTVKEVQERVLPPLDAEFFKLFSVETEAALRQRLRDDMQETARTRELARQKGAIVRHLLEQTRFELPQSVVDNETRAAVRNMVQDFARRGASRDQIVEQQESIVNEAARSSSDRVRLSYILGRIADAEQITVSDEALEERLRAMAARYEMPLERFREELKQRDAIEGIRGELRAERTLDFLLQQAKIN